MARNRNKRTITTNDSIQLTDQVLLLDVSAGAFQLDLPDSTSDGVEVGHRIYLIPIGGDIVANNVTLVPFVGDGTTVTGGVNMVLDSDTVKVLELMENQDWTLIIGEESASTGGLPLEGRNIYVSALGNDSTGETGNPNKPFKTVAAAQALAITLNPLLTNPVYILLYDGTFNEDVTLTTSFIYLRAVKVGSLLFDRQNPGLSATYVPGTLPENAQQAVGGWTALETFDDYTGVNFTIGGETWVGTDAYAGAPFTYGPVSFFDPETMFDNFIANFNANNTQGLIAHYNLGDLRVDTGFFNYSEDGITITTDGSEAPNFASKNGIACNISDPTKIVAGLGEEVSPTEGGTSPVVFISGSGTPTITRGVFIDGTLIVESGVVTLVEGVDCQSIYLKGVVTSSSFKNLNVYAEITADGVDANSWYDVHSPSFFETKDTLGTYTFCSGGDYAFSGKATADGVYKNNVCKNFGYGLKSITGIFIGNEGDDFCFGRAEAGALHSGDYIENVGKNYCFSPEKYQNAVLLRNTGIDFCFGYIDNLMLTRIPNGVNVIECTVTTMIGCEMRNEGFGYSEGNGGSEYILGAVCVFRDCSARIKGFLVADVQGKITKTSGATSTYTNCSVLASSQGGFLCAINSGAVVDVRGVSFINCTKNTGTSFGSTTANGSLIATDVRFQDCQGQRIMEFGGITAYNLTDVTYIGCFGRQRLFNNTSSSPLLSFTRVLIQDCTADNFFGLNATSVAAVKDITFQNITHRSISQTLFSLSPFAFKLIDTKFKTTAFAAPLTVADGAIVMGCVLIAGGGGAESIAANTPINAKIWLNSLNQPLSANITLPGASYINLIDPTFDI